MIILLSLMEELLASITSFNFCVCSPWVLNYPPHVLKMNNLNSEFNTLATKQFYAMNFAVPKFRIRQSSCISFFFTDNSESRFKYLVFQLK